MTSGIESMRILCQDLTTRIQELERENTKLHNQIRAFELDIYGADAQKKIDNLESLVRELVEALNKIVHSEHRDYDVRNKKFVIIVEQEDRDKIDIVLAHAKEFLGEK
jgi:hypothetical protein